MAKNDWDVLFGKDYFIGLTNTERTYFALNPLSEKWESASYYSKTNMWYTRVVAYFEGNIIVKVIHEEKRMLADNTVNFLYYQEYDTKLETEERKLLLPLTQRGKPKKLSASNISSVLPFGCRFHIQFQKGKETYIVLDNPRGNVTFPVGEWERIGIIKNDQDFHDFSSYYISSCSEDYFEKLNGFRKAGKRTVKYNVGDIFRMDLDRTRYCYGVIIGDVKKIQSFPELPDRHSLRQLMMVPVMVRFYQLITNDPNMKKDDLKNIPMGRLSVCADNDIIWGQHTIVDHKLIAPEDLEFNLVCVKQFFDLSQHETLFTQDRMYRDGMIKDKSYSLFIEWGTAQVLLASDRISPELKAIMDSYSSPHGGVKISIDPVDAVPDAKGKSTVNYRMNLLNPENREIRALLFSALGLQPDSDFDEFAAAFNGLTKEELCNIILKQ